MKNKKGFTLIEILAVIIIIAILLTIGVLSVSKYIQSSKKNLYAVTAKEYIKSATTFVNSEKFKKVNQSVTYYIPEKCIPIEKERRSPNGKFKEAYVVVTYDKQDGYTYYWMSRDSIDQGFYLTKSSLLDEKLLSNSMKELVPNIGIKNKNKIMILNDSCDLNGVDIKPAEVSMNKDYLTNDDINNPSIIPSNPGETPQPTELAMLGTSAVLWNGIDKIKIESVKIENNKNVPTDALKSWDVSDKQDGSVMAWYKDSNNNGLYEMSIGANSKIYANSNSSFLFGDLSNVVNINLNSFDTSKVTNMNGMFSDCRRLTNLDVSKFDTSKVTNMGAMFAYCKKLTSLNISNFNTSKVTNMVSMFNRCNSLTNLDVSKFDTSNVTSMGYMFSYCYNLTSLNISNFNTSNVTNTVYMFAYCYNLTSLNISNFNTSNVTNMKEMFSWCENLTNLDLSNFNTSNVTNMRDMFAYCKKLTSLNLSGFNTLKVTDMSYMFDGCENLTNLNLSNFNTSKVTDMLSMFRCCEKLSELNIKSFEITSSTNINQIFNSVNNNITITVKNNEIKGIIKNLYPSLNVVVA